MHLTRHAAAVIAAAGLLLAGCGGGGDDGAGAAPGGEPTPTALTGGDADEGAGPSSAPDPCGLLTEREIAEHVGTEVTSTAGPAEEFMGTQCEWFFPGGIAGDAQVTVTVWVGHEFYSPEGPGADATGFEEVPGIGDLAHRWPPGQGICTVIFRTGELVVQVLSTDTGDEVCVDLARMVDARL
jgi:hypothetical protein